MTKTIFDDMTNLYSLSKTLRFELKPVGRTAEFIEKKGFFDKDIEKAEAYPDIKQKLDALHRNFIESSLSRISILKIEETVMDDFFAKKDMKIHYKQLRSTIVGFFEGSKELSGENMLVKLLGESSESEKENIQKFKGFLGYFSTYNQNRENLYKNEDKAGQIAFRLIDENLPRFFKAKELYYKIAENHSSIIIKERDSAQQETEKNISEYGSWFNLDTYHKYLSQSGVDSFNEMVGHINLSINLYKQQTGEKLGFLPLLYKLPLAPRKEIGWLPKQIDDMEELQEHLLKTATRINNKLIPFLKNIFNNTSGYDENGIYVSFKTSENRGGIGLNGWQSLRELSHEKEVNGEEAKVKKEKTNFPFISLNDIKEYLIDKQEQGVETESVFGEKIRKDAEKKEKHEISDYSEFFFSQIQKYINKIVAEYQQSEKAYKALPEHTETIKKLMDSAITIWRFLNGFALVHKKQHLTPSIKESNFYDGINGLDGIIDDADYPDPIHTTYDKIRNYLTKKPYSNDEKIKINFDNPTLLAGRDQNKEKDNSGIILRNGESFFLVLMKKGYNSFFDEKKNIDLYVTSDKGLEKMVYKLLPGPNKMLPKVIFSEKNIKDFAPSSEILRIRKEETFKQGDQFSIKDLHTWIDFLKKSLGIYEGRKHYSFSFLPTEKYQKINEFYHDVESQGYEIKRKGISKDMLDSAVEKGEIYLFQINNKDFNQFAQGTKNMHTKYFQALFQGGADNLYKLNGEAEIFWRKGILEAKTREISPKYQKNITEKKRYTADKLMIHIPITLNFCRDEKKFNENFNKTLMLENKNVAILGIDRGEKHLLYYSLIKSDGTIIKTGSRNKVGDKEIDYHEKLDIREKSRDEAQANRVQQEQIKDLKMGYISQVIHEISKLVIENNAIIILEDLNRGFKRGRQKVEKNVYQQLELALAKKLNYLVFKNKGDDELGGIHKAYQLTPPVAQFKDLSFQTGILYYTPAGYTSTTCPCCGRRKNIYLKYENEIQAKKDLSKIDIVKGSEGRDIFYEIEESTTGKSAKSSVINLLEKTKRTLHTKSQIRLSYDSKTKQTIKFDITKEFDKLFDGFSDYSSWLNSAGASGCKSLIYNLNLLMKMRNSQTGTDTDLISCPACGFDSKNGFQDKEYNGDANGAYNIARKGNLIIKKIIADGKTTVSQVECENERQK